MIIEGYRSSHHVGHHRGGLCCLTLNNPKEPTKTMNTYETAILLDKKAVSTMLSLSTKSVALLIHDGRLKTIPMGRRILVHRDEVARFASVGIKGSIRA